jgi:DNA helicase II / ATP-dependent DNA helicase PcrA
LSAAGKVVPEAEYITGTVKEGIFDLNAFSDEEEESRWVVDKINELIGMKKHNDIEGDITSERIAVLARNKYVFKTLESQLRDRSLPFYYKMTPGSILFESDLMKIFDLALRVRLNHKISCISNDCLPV